MSGKKKYLLRIDGDLYAAMEKWAADDLRSINAQIEYLLMEAVRRAGRRIHRQENSSLPEPEKTMEEDSPS